MLKYLKGFANFGVLPITENTTSKYAVGTVIKLTGAKTCAPTDNKSDYTIYADDGVYDNGAEWKDTTVVVTIYETELSSLAALTGATIDETKSELEECYTDSAPEVAITYSALRRDGGYRLYRYYAAKCTSYKLTHNTRGENNEAQGYELTFKCKARNYDGKIRGTKDIAKGDALTWIDTIPTQPEIVGG